MTVPDAELVHLDTAKITPVRDAYDRAARQVRGAASGLLRAIPPVPDDPSGMAQAFIAFDEARERFDLHLAETFGAASARIDALVQGATLADERARFPKAGG